jgi:hypothetical protein
LCTRYPATSTVLQPVLPVWQPVLPYQSKHTIYLMHM